ncbi:MAG: hypothetical protein D6826_01040 [Alphaproteobacteria bacterium]|nr:MAG: hypothetical protein D6826_01040 [Alphaproteobacteria bacterium]
MKGCRNCNHWDALDEYLDRDDPATAGQKVRIGLCRRYAPRPSVAPPGTDTGPGASLWARVNSDDWCGEWDPKFS